MNYFYSCNTDIGFSRKINQDALVIKSLHQKNKRALLAAVCDGVGGLSLGEMASRKSVEMLSDWFDYEIPQILGSGQEEEVIRNRMRQLLSDINREIIRQGKQERGCQGTTLTTVFFWNYQYVLGHVGDSRAYEITKQVRQLTKDHTWLAREVEQGRMTEAEAGKDSRKNAILQCIGVDPDINPQVESGTISHNSSILLCSDGFWHEFTKEEMVKDLFLEAVDQNVLQIKLQKAIELVKARGETDNITAIVIRFLKEDRV